MIYTHAILRFFNKYKELILVFNISVCFLGLALIGLGYRDVPITTLTLSQGDAFYIDLGTTQKVDSVLILLKIGESTIKIQSGTPDNWGSPITKSIQGYYYWEKIPLSEETGYVRFEFETYETELAEVSITDALGDKLDISAIYSDKNSISGLERLIDEQEKVMLPITAMSETNFDEIYFVRAAEDYLKGRNPYENTHPPLGKEIIALGIMLMGYSPYGWRLLDALFAALMIPAFYIFCFELTGNRMCGVLASFLLSLDFMHFTYARIATIDTFVVFFSIMSWIFFFRYFKKWKSDKENQYKELLLWAILSGLAFSTKWYALFGLLGQFLIIIVYVSIGLIKSSREQLKIQLSSAFKRVFLFIIICGVVYLNTYLPQVVTGFTLSNIVSEQFNMLSYHTGLTASHPFSSPWYSWPVILRPLWLYVSELSSNTVSTIVAMGNPALWWLGFASIIIFFFRFYRYKDLTSLFIITLFSFQWLPYALMSRPLFIYHYYVNVPILCLALAIIMKDEWDNRKERCLTVILLLIVIIIFIFFYPVISGYPVSRDVINSLRWFSSWIF